jgi:hypothetical protein
MTNCFFVALRNIDLAKPTQLIVEQSLYNHWFGEADYYTVETNNTIITVASRIAAE